MITPLGFTTEAPGTYALDLPVQAHEVVSGLVAEMELLLDEQKQAATTCLNTGQQPREVAGEGDF